MNRFAAIANDPRLSNEQKRAQLLSALSALNEADMSDEESLDQSSIWPFLSEQERDAISQWRDCLCGLGCEKFPDVIAEYFRRQTSQ